MANVNLKNIPLFKNFPDAELIQLNNLLQEKTYNVGDVIFNQGEEGGNLYIIEEGRVQISLLIQGLVNEFEKISVLGAGNFLGELSLIDSKKHSAKATVLDTSKILILKQDAFKQIIKQNPQRGLELQEELMLSLIRIIREFNTRYSDLSGYIAT